MPIFRKNKKPQPAHELSWRRPPSGVPMSDPQHFAEALGAFEEDALSLADATIARDRSEEVAHVS